MRKPKVLQVCAVDVSVGPLLRPLVHALREAGAEVHVACSPGGELDRLAAEGVPVRPVRIARKILSPRHPVSLVQLARLIRRKRYDFVHVHTPIAAALGRAAVRLSGARPVVLYTAHGFYFHDRMRPWLRWVLIQQERLFGRLCTDFLFTVSPEDHATALLERIIDLGRPHCLNSLGIDLERFGSVPARGLQRSDIGLSKDDRVIAYVGRLVREKGVIDLLEAMAVVKQRMPQARLVVVGDTLQSDRGRRIQKEIRALLAKHQLAGSVAFLGFRSDVSALLPLVDVFVLLSYREGMPLTILEAMACGLPVVSFDCPTSPREILGNGRFGVLVPVQDEHSLAMAILALLNDEGQRLGFARRGKTRALDFDVPGIAREYRRLLEGRSAGKQAKPAAKQEDWERMKA